MVTAMLWLGVVTAFGIHYLLSRSRWPWLGAIAPTVLVVLVAAWAAYGHMRSVRDWLMAALSVLILVRIAAAGVAARNKSLAEARGDV